MDTSRLQPGCDLMVLIRNVKGGNWEADRRCGPNFGAKKCQRRHAHHWEGWQGLGTTALPALGYGRNVGYGITTNITPICVLFVKN